MKAFYFISSFGLVEKDTSNDEKTMRDLKSCGNFYTSEKEALDALAIIKNALRGAKSNINMRNVRLGDWFFNGSRKVQVTATNIASGMTISAIPLTESVLRTNGFNEDGGSFTLETDGSGIVVSNLGDMWKVSVHSEDFVFAGHINSVHELQHILQDCYIDLDVSL